MPRHLVQLISVLLLALWLPATLHCQLEAAGLGDQHQDGCCTDPAQTGATDCRDDACANIEASLHKEAAPRLALSAPEACDCLLCLADFACACTGCTEPALSPARHAVPPELAVTWQFVARAAPPARAPSLNT